MGVTDGFGFVEVAFAKNGTVAAPAVALIQATLESSPPFDNWYNVQWYDMIVSSDMAGPVQQPEMCEVGIADLTTFGSYYGHSFDPESPSDLTGDGYTNAGDFCVFGASWLDWCWNYNPRIRPTTEGPPREVK